MSRIVKALFIVLLFVIVCIGSYFFVGASPVPDNITWGVNFSQMQAETLGLNWKAVYLAILQDLGAKK